jgi:hypothetical protein
MGHLGLVETTLCRFLGVEHDSDLAQLPMSALLEAQGLGHFIRPLYASLGCTTMPQLAQLTEEELTAAGLDSQQVRLCACLCSSARGRQSP